MDKNNIITAPQISHFSYFYEKWKINHTGSQSEFYRFMTSPSVDRDEFIRSLDSEISHVFAGSVAEVTLHK